MDASVAAKIRHLSMKTVQNGCTLAEENTAQAKIAELKEKYASSVTTTMWINARVYDYYRCTLDLYLANSIAARSMQIYSHVIQYQKPTLCMFGDKPEVAKSISLFRELIDLFDIKWKEYKAKHTASLKYKQCYLFSFALSAQQAMGEIVKSAELTRQFQRWYPEPTTLNMSMNYCNMNEYTIKEATHDGLIVGQRLRVKYCTQ